MSSANSDGFTSSFPTRISFISFSSLIVVTGTFKIMLNKKCESGHHCLVPHLRGIVFSFSPLSMSLCLSCMAFIMLRSVLSVPSFWRIFIINWCWILSKAFHVSIEMIIWFFLDYMVFILQFVNVVCHIDWFVDLKNLCIPGINPTWSWCMIFLM